MPLGTSKKKQKIIWREKPKSSPNTYETNYRGNNDSWENPIWFMPFDLEENQRPFRDIWKDIKQTHNRLLWLLRTILCKKNPILTLYRIPRQIFPTKTISHSYKKNCIVCNKVDFLDSNLFFFFFADWKTTF